MIQKVKNVLKRRKVKLFTLFLILSGLSWFISNLSNRYESSTVFNLSFVNPPDSMMLLSASQKQIEVRLDAVGFNFLGYNFAKKTVNIDLSEANRIGAEYLLSPNTIASQIEKQLSNGIRLVRTKTDTLFVEFYGVISKSVAVQPRIKLQFAQNYLLDGSISIQPDSVIIKGPVSEIDSINYVRTEALDLVDLKSDFSVTSNLEKPIGLKKTVFSTSEVDLRGKVSRFSEKILRVPISIINLPENTKAQTFPNEVDVLIKASLADLKGVRKSDIKVVGDYNTINTDSKVVLLRVVKQPNRILSAELVRNNVDFILKRE